ncbi:hypothetical protein [Corynebacterium capitovis]|nr:hypothetical protein [Corynebacterium capitovis]
MQAPIPREQVQLTSQELDTFDCLTGEFERSEEHLVDPSLALYVTR